MKYRLSVTLSLLFTCAPVVGHIGALPASAQHVARDRAHAVGQRAAESTTPAEAVRILLGESPPVNTRVRPSTATPETQTQPGNGVSTPRDEAATEVSNGSVHSATDAAIDADADAQRTSSPDLHDTDATTAGGDTSNRVIPDAAVADTAEPNTAEPNTAEPNTAEPNTANPNTVTLNAEIADIGEPPTLTRRALGALAPAVDVATVPQRNQRSHSAPPAMPFDEDVINTIQSGIRSALSRDEVAGHWLSALVMDFETGQVLFEENPGRALKPASNTKLFTTAAALALYGADHQFVTRVYADSAPIDGVIDGDLYIVGGYDFTWSDYFYPAGDWPVEIIVRQLRDAGVERIEGSVHVVGTFIINPHNFHAFDRDDHRSHAASAFSRHLRRADIPAGAIRTSGEVELPPGATELTRFYSPSLASAVVPINRISHNEMADALMLYIAERQRASSDYIAGSDVTAELLTHWGIDTEGFRLFDGSGLNHDNRVTARQLLELIEVAQHSDWSDAFNQSLSIGGVDGTLSGRLSGADTVGRVFGKTGTINRVVTTSGFLLHRNMNHRIGFAILMNELSSQDAARAVHNRMIDAFAGDITDAGTPLDNPELGTLVSNADGTGARLSWRDVRGADAYHIEWTSARRGWSQSSSTIVTGRSTEIPTGANEGPLLVRVRAMREGVFGPTSDMYAVVPASRGSRLLLVDGNQRFENQISAGNAIGAGHDFIAQVALALADERVDSASSQAVAGGEIDPGAYATLVWLLGEESSDNVTLSERERALLRRFVAGGGELLISGSELAFDLSERGSADALAFLSDSLATGLVSDSARVEMAAGTGPCAQQPPLHFLAPGTMSVRYPDVLDDSAATRCLSYLDDDDGAAAVLHPELPVLTVGFPIEAVETAGARERLMAILLGTLRSRSTP